MRDELPLVLFPKPWLTKSDFSLFYANCGKAPAMKRGRVDTTVKRCHVCTGESVRSWSRSFRARQLPLGIYNGNEPGKLGPRTAP